MLHCIPVYALPNALWEAWSLPVSAGPCLKITLFFPSSDTSLDYFFTPSWKTISTHTIQSSPNLVKSCLLHFCCLALPDNAAGGEKENRTKSNTVVWVAGPAWHICVYRWSKLCAEMTQCLQTIHNENEN